MTRPATPLSGSPRLYALGPLEGCRGEVTIVAGVPSVATVVEGRPSVASGFDHRACFLVSSEVPAWGEERLADEVADDGLVDAIVRRAIAARIPAPFPFLIRRHVVQARLHVLDKRDGERHTAGAARGGQGALHP